MCVSIYGQEGAARYDRKLFIPFSIQVICLKLELTLFPMFYQASNYFSLCQEPDNCCVMMYNDKSGLLRITSFNEK